MADKGDGNLAGDLTIFLEATVNKSGLQFATVCHDSHAFHMTKENGHVKTGASVQEASFLDISMILGILRYSPTPIQSHIGFAQITLGKRNIRF